MGVLAAVVLCLCGCDDEPKAEEITKMGIDKEAYGTTPDGEKVELFTLTNSNGIKVGIINYGGIVTSIEVPDRDGMFAYIVLGCDNLDKYLKNGSYFGALIGRYGNRIAKGKFSIDGKEYRVRARTRGKKHLS